MLDIRQSPGHAKFLRSMGWVVETKNGVNYFIKKLPLLGSFMKIQRPKEINLKLIKALTKKHRIIHTVIEPQLTCSNRSGLRTVGNHTSIPVTKNNHTSLYPPGFSKCKSPFLPAKTIFINLTQTESRLIESFHPKTRYNIKKSQRLGIKIHKSKDINTFINLWHLWHKKRLLFLSQAKQIEAFYRCYGKDADLLLATEGKETVAGLLLLSFDKVTYYMYAGSSNRGKSLFAPTLIIWEALKLAKKRQSNIFDFEGIYDERFPLKSWLGFTKFKKSFGGCEITFPPPYQNLSVPFCWFT